jgi:hypothetical protein
LLFQREKKENFLDSQSIFLEPSESLNTGPFNLFPSHVCRASEWQGTLASESTGLLRGSVTHPQHIGCFDRMLILDVDPSIKTSDLLIPVQNQNCTKVSLADTNLSLWLVSFYIKPWDYS